MAEPDNIKPGDVVKLKSDGPEMTVAGFGMDGSDFSGQALCGWFYASEYKTAWFRPEQLRKIR